MKCISLHYCLFLLAWILILPLEQSMGARNGSGRAGRGDDIGA